MKIYIASRTAWRDEVKEINKLLKSYGHKVLDSTWHKYIKPYDKNKQLAKNYAIEDLGSIKSCDVFILLADKSFGAGSTTELGAAIALSIENKRPRVYVIGDISSNLFYYHPVVNYRKSIDEAIEEILNSNKKPH